MALNWWLENIKDWERKCYRKVKTDKFGINREREDLNELKPLTNLLIWSSLTIGMNRITEKNASEFHRRLIALEILTTGVKKGSMPTLKEVQDHIGLSTNATKHTTAYWERILLSKLSKKIDERINS
jgi:hypothetical protein